MQSDCPLRERAPGYPRGEHEQFAKYRKTRSRRKPPFVKAAKPGLPWSPASPGPAGSHENLVNAGLEKSVVP